MIAKQSLTKSRVDFAFSVSFSADPYANRFLYTGREFMKEAGLYDYRNRVYSAELGRFLQSDPIRFDAGDYNLYRYVSNRVTRSTDAMGLAESSCSERRIDPRGDEDEDGNPKYKDDKDGIDFDGDGKDFEKNTRRDNDNRGGGGGGGMSQCMRDCLASYGALTEWADQLGWWGAASLGAGVAGEAIGRVGDKLADRALDRLSSAAIDSGALMMRRLAIASAAHQQAGRIAAKRGALAIASKVSGVGGAVATGVSAGLRGHCALQCAGR